MKKILVRDQLIMALAIVAMMIVYIVVFVALLFSGHDNFMFAWLFFGFIALSIGTAKLYFRYDVLGSIYVTSSKAQKENMAIAKERYEFINKTLSDDAQKTKYRLAKWIGFTCLSFILVIVSAFLINTLRGIEVVMLAFIGVSLWSFFYTFAVYFKCKDVIKKEVIVKELNSIDNSLDYKNLTQDVDLDTDVFKVNEKNLKIGREHSLSITIYEDSGFDSEVSSSNFNTSNYAEYNIKTKLSSGETLAIQSITSNRRYSDSIKLLFKGVFAFFDNYKIKPENTYIRMANSKHLVNRDYRGRKFLVEDDLFRKNYFVYIDNESVANKVFSQSTIDRLNQLNDEYGYKFEVLITEGDIYIRAFIADFLNCNTVRKGKLIKSLAKDITYIDFIKKIASIMYDATKE